jgi:hypothetical protein
MEHEFIADFSDYYDEKHWGASLDVETDYPSYYCKKCKVAGIRNNEDGEILVMFLEFENLTCDEIIIKNIIE